MGDTLIPAFRPKAAICYLSRMIHTDKLPNTPARRTFGYPSGGPRMIANWMLCIGLALGGGLLPDTAAAASAPAQKESSAVAEPDADAIQQVFKCLSEGLPESWQHSWVIATETQRNGSSREFQVVFRYADAEADATGTRFAPCSAQSLPADIIRINAELARQWREIRLDFYRDGRFDLRYDNPK